MSLTERVVPEQGVRVLPHGAVVVERVYGGGEGSRGGVGGRQRRGRRGLVVMVVVVVR